MKTHTVAMALLAGAALAGFARAQDDEPPAPPANKLIPTAIKQTKTRIEKLFHAREVPVPAYEQRMNPFRQPGETPPVFSGPTAPAGQGTSTAEPPPDSDVTLLQEAIKSMVVANGTIAQGSQVFVVINGKPYKETDSLTIKTASGKTVYLRVGKITAISVTFILNSAERKLDLK